MATLLGCILGTMGDVAQGFAEADFLDVVKLQVFGLGNFIGFEVDAFGCLQMKLPQNVACFLDAVFE